MWQCLSMRMMKKKNKPRNLQVSFIPLALVNKDVYYNRAKEKVSFGGQPNMERFCGKQVPIIWKTELKETAACFLFCPPVALGFLCIEPEIQPHPHSHSGHIFSPHAVTHPGSCSASPSHRTLIPTFHSNPWPSYLQRQSVPNGIWKRF